MTKILFTPILFFFFATVHAQEDKEYYEKGIELARLGKAEDAIGFFDRSIALNPKEYVAWYNRGVAKSMIHYYEGAVTDFDQAIILSPKYKKAFLNRGTAKKHITDYEGAMADYDYAIKLDTVYAEAYYYRGLLYNLLGKRVEACMDFNHARHLGYEDAKPEMQSCIRRPIADDTSIHSILRLSRIADNDQYGFTPEHPVKVGDGPEGGPANARSYLDLLRDPKGKPLKYQHIAICCPYESTHAFFGKEAMEEKYQITYTAADGTEKKAFFYISFYDYEEPLIPAGLRTLAPQ